MSDDAAKRLRDAAKGAGYESAADFARALGEKNESTVRSHFNGARNFSAETAKRYAAKIGMDWRWLLFGDDIAAQSKEGREHSAKIDHELLQAVVNLVLEFADPAASRSDVALLVSLLYDEFAAASERPSEKEMRMAVKIAARSAGLKGRA